MRHTWLNILGTIAVVASVIFAIKIKGEKVMNTGIKIDSIETSVNPADDFFDYATLRWRRANPIPDDYVRYGAFEILHDKNLNRVREIAEKDTGKIGTLYKIAMNEARLNTDGVVGAKKYFDEIDAIKSKDELPEYLGRMHGFISSFWGDSVGLDERDSEHYLYNIH
jgi:putative endopeptidase